MNAIAHFALATEQLVTTLPACGEGKEATHTYPAKCLTVLKYLHMVGWGKYAWKTPKTKIGLTSRRVRDKWNTSWKQLRRQTARSYIQQIVQLCGFWLLVDTMAILLNIFLLQHNFWIFLKGNVQGRTTQFKQRTVLLKKCFAAPKDDWLCTRIQSLEKWIWFKWERVPPIMCAICWSFSSADLPKRNPFLPFAIHRFPA